jgi:hypothetical protein
MRSLESLNVKDNALAGESSDALLFLVKENRNVTRCNVELNMIKYTALVEIDRTCRKNKASGYLMDIPTIRREIKGLRR